MKIKDFIPPTHYLINRIFELSDKGGHVFTNEDIAKILKESFNITWNNFVRKSQVKNLRSLKMGKYVYYGSEKNINLLKKKIDEN